MDTIKSITKAGYTLNIYIDENPISPREDDNIGKLYIPRPPRGCTLTDKNASGEERKAAPVIIPVYCLDHSGIAIRSTPFNDPWDSWLAGSYYVTTEKIAAEYGEVSAESIKKAESVARAELRTFAEYVSGEVYLYTIEDASGDILDAVSGYYGDEGIQYINQEFEDYIGRRILQENPLFVFAGINPETLDETKKPS